MAFDWSAIKGAALGASASWGSPAVRGALVGAGVGAAWGAVSSREGIVTGALKGAAVGAIGATAYKYGQGFSRLKPFYSKVAQLNQAKNWRDNLRNAWDFMGRYKFARPAIGAFAGFGAVSGMFSGDDNPAGGAIGGAIAGGIQGTALYGGIYGASRAIKRFRR